MYKFYVDRSFYFSAINAQEFNYWQKDIWFFKKQLNCFQFDMIATPFLYSHQ